MQILNLKFNKAERGRTSGSRLQQSKGFAILFTVLISAIILAIALGVTSISYQEIVLSSSAKEGNIAFFAADAGAECALYWDTLGAFDQAPKIPVCNGLGSVVSYSIDNFISTFRIRLNSGQNCAIVSVDKNAVIDSLATPPILGTKIESLGYNVACNLVNAGGPRIVERAIRVTY